MFLCFLEGKKVRGKGVPRELFPSVPIRCSLQSVALPTPGTAATLFFFLHIKCKDTRLGDGCCQDNG